MPFRSVVILQNQCKLQIFKPRLFLCETCVHTNAMWVTALALIKVDLMIFVFFSQSLDELENDDAVEKDRREEEEELVQANTFQNEAMTADPSTGHLMVRREVTGGGRRKLHAPFSSVSLCDDLLFLPLLEHHIADIDTSMLPNRGTVAQGDTRRVCVKSGADAKPKGVSAFHHRREIS